MATFWGANLDFGHANRRTMARRGDLSWSSSPSPRRASRSRRDNGDGNEKFKSRGASRRGANSIGRHTPRATSLIVRREGVTSGDTRRREP